MFTQNTCTLYQVRSTSDWTMIMTKWSMITTNQYQTGKLKFFNSSNSSGTQLWLGVHLLGDYGESTQVLQ